MCLEQWYFETAQQDKKLKNCSRIVHKLRHYFMGQGVKVLCEHSKNIGTCLQLFEICNLFVCCSWCENIFLIVNKQDLLFSNPHFYILKLLDAIMLNTWRRICDVIYRLLATQLKKGFFSITYPYLTQRMQNAKHLKMCLKWSSVLHRNFLTVSNMSSNLTETFLLDSYFTNL